MTDVLVVNASPVIFLGNAVAEDRTVMWPNGGFQTYVAEAWYIDN
jgi:hypothetical protein